jgi:hypothetical protein
MAAGIRRIMKKTHWAGRAEQRKTDSRKWGWSAGADTVFWGLRCPLTASTGELAFVMRFIGKPQTPKPGFLHQPAIIPTGQ